MHFIFNLYRTFKILQIAFVTYTSFLCTRTYINILDFALPMSTIALVVHRAMELHSEVENLRLQLESRPTMRQWTQAQRDRFDPLLT